MQVAWISTRDSETEIAIDSDATTSKKAPALGEGFQATVTRDCASLPSAHDHGQDHRSAPRRLRGRLRRDRRVRALTRRSHGPRPRFATRGVRDPSDRCPPGYRRTFSRTRELQLARGDVHDETYTDEPSHRIPPRILVFASTSSSNRETRVTGRPPRDPAARKPPPASAGWISRSRKRNPPPAWRAWI